MKDRKISPVILCIDMVLVAIAKFLTFFGVAAVILIIILACADAVAAKVFGSSVPYGNSLITYLSVPTAFSAIAYTQLCESHVNVEVIYGKFPKPVQKVVKIICCIVCSLTCFGVTIFGGEYMISRLVSHATSGTPGFVIWPFVAFMVVCFGMLAIAFLWGIVRIIVGMDKSFDKERVRGVLDQSELEDTLRKLNEGGPTV